MCIIANKTGLLKILKYVETGEENSLQERCAEVD